MKNTLTKIAILLLSVNLVACSTNTQSQNTGLGAVTGGVAGGGIAALAGANPVVIGVSAVAGALIGGFIGHSADSSDKVAMDHSMNNRTNHSTTWTNRKTGATYTVTPTSKRMAYHGYSDCRMYTTTARYHGKVQRVHGTACMQSNGTWKAM
jgi:surface antigen